MGNRKAANEEADGRIEALPIHKEYRRGTPWRQWILRPAPCPRSSCSKLRYLRERARRNAERRAVLEVGEEEERRMGGGVCDDENGLVTVETGWAGGGHGVNGGKQRVMRWRVMRWRVMRWRVHLCCLIEWRIHHRLTNSNKQYIS